MVKNISYYANLSFFTYSNNDIENYSYFDDSGKQFVTYANVSGNKNINFGSGFTKTFKWKENKLSLNPRFSTNNTFNRGFINSVQYTSDSYTINPSFNLTYEIKDKITVKPS